MPGAVRSRALDLGHRARSAAARLRQAGHGLEEDWLRDTINTMMLDKLMKDSENHVLVFQPLIIDDVRFRQAQRLDKLPHSVTQLVAFLFFRRYGVGASTIMTCRPMHPGSCEVASKEGASEGCFQEYEE